MMMNRWIVKKKTLQEVMILGILQNHQRGPIWVVKRGCQGI